MKAPDEITSAIRQAAMTHMGDKSEFSSVTVETACKNSGNLCYNTSMNVYAGDACCCICDCRREMYEASHVEGREDHGKK